MQADRNALFRLTQARHTVYEQQHFRPMTTQSIAQLISVTLYHKRFFPFYTFNLVAGVDEKGSLFFVVLFSRFWLPLRF